MFGVIKLIKDRILDVMVLLNVRVFEKEVDHVKRFISNQIDDYSHKCYIYLHC